MPLSIEHYITFLFKNKALLVHCNIPVQLPVLHYSTLRVPLRGNNLWYKQEAEINQFKDNKFWTNSYNAKI